MQEATDGPRHTVHRCPDAPRVGNPSVEGILPKILQALAFGDPLRNLEEKQAICKQFADLLWFVMEFDELKVRPARAGTVRRGRTQVAAKRGGGRGIKRPV